MQSYKIIDGKSTSLKVKVDLATKVAGLVAAGHRAPHLAAILVGDNGASATYVASKVKTCQEIGYKSTLLHFPVTITEEDLLSKIHEVNNDPEIDGLIVQLPLPKHINIDKVTLAIKPSKDVDGFHPMNQGRMLSGMPAYLPATPAGIMQLLKEYKIETSGKNCVILGRSNIVGTPMGILLSRNSYPGNCTVTICHSRTQDLSDHLLKADIIIAALGIPGFLKGEMVKEGAVVIDVGITRIDDPSKKSGFRLSGDVDFDTVAPKCSYITPVPGGVGPMTIIGLLQNTLQSCMGEIYSSETSIV